MMRGCISAGLLALLLTAVPTAAVAEDGGRIAVLDMQGSGVDSGTLEVLNEIISTEAAAAATEAKAGSVISSSDIKSMLGFEAQKSLMGCDEDASCLAEIGGALGASRVLVSSVGKVGSKYVVNVKLIDITSAKTLSRVYQQVQGEDALIEAIRASVQKVFGVEGAVTPELMPAASSGSGKTAAAWVGLGAAVVGLGLGIGFTYEASSVFREAWVGENRDIVNPAFTQINVEWAYNHGRASQIIGASGFGLAAAGLLTSSYFFLTREPSDTRDLTVGIGPGSVAVAGRFEAP